MEQRRLPHLALHPTSEKRGGAEVFQKFFLDRDRETVQASSLLGEGQEGGGESRGALSYPPFSAFSRFSSGSFDPAFHVFM